MTTPKPPADNSSIKTSISSSGPVLTLLTAPPWAADFQPADKVLVVTPPSGTVGPSTPSNWHIQSSSSSISYKIYYKVEGENPDFPDLPPVVMELDVRVPSFGTNAGSVTFYDCATRKVVGPYTQTAYNCSGSFDQTTWHPTVHAIVEFTTTEPTAEEKSGPGFFHS